MSTPDERTLIDQVRAGDLAAFAELLQAYRPRMLAVVERQMSALLRQKVDPDDLVQEVAISCIQAFPDVDLRHGDPFHWVSEMIRRRVIDAGRHYTGAEKRDAQREVPLQGGGTAAPGGLIAVLVASMTTPSAACLRNEREQKMSAAIGQLSTVAQTALRLRYLDSLPTKEIARQLGKSDGAIRVLLTRSLQRLQVILEP